MLLTEYVAEAVELMGCQNMELDCGSLPWRNIAASMRAMLVSWVLGVLLALSLIVPLYLIEWSA